MNKFLLVFFLALFNSSALLSQSVSDSKVSDSVNTQMLQTYKAKISEIDAQRKSDSANKANLEQQLIVLQANDVLKREKIQKQLNDLQKKETDRIAHKKAQIDSLRKAAVGYPVMGLMHDTLFLLYTKMGSYTAKERAQNISMRIIKMYEDDFAKPDSITVIESDSFYDIMYKDKILMSVLESDGLWNNMPTQALAQQYAQSIKTALVKAHEENSWSKFLIRLAWVALALCAVVAMIFIVNKLHKWITNYFQNHKEQWLKDLSYKDYVLLTATQELNVILFLFKIFKWIAIILLLYLLIPVIFSIFPFTRGWADQLFGLVWNPFKKMLAAIWAYMPNVFTILVILFIMKYVIRLVKYIFSEIETGKLKINGFHSDWALPTYSIIRFLLYAFMFILIFPYLPGSDSTVFKGVSVFIGVLFSLGSSSAIANMVAGLVITYMRPFKTGDKIKIGEISGTVVEKTLLVTRLKTAVNEEITIPNSTVLSVNTVNYNAYAQKEGLIVHTTISIGYDTAWQEVHKALIDAALRSPYTLPEPAPFVLQPALGDFYVSYELHAYTREANAQAEVYSELHKNIQDVCNERGIEIMSPHYHAHRDGNHTTIPHNYLTNSYKQPPFHIHVKKD